MELLEIYDATKKMLPEEYLNSVANDSGVKEATKSSQPLENGVKKRTMDFMGVHVSYPQYARLRSIQKEVIKMDQIIRRMVSQGFALKGHFFHPFELTRSDLVEGLLWVFFSTCNSDLLLAPCSSGCVAFSPTSFPS